MTESPQFEELKWTASFRLIHILNPRNWDRINFLKMPGIFKQEMEDIGKGKGGNRN